MTKPEEMRANAMSTLQYLDTVLPTGSHVGRLCWQTDDRCLGWFSARREGAIAGNMGRKGVHCVRGDLVMGAARIRVMIVRCSTDVCTMVYANDMMMPQYEIPQ